MRDASTRRGLAVTWTWMRDRSGGGARQTVAGQSRVKNYLSMRNQIGSIVKSNWDTMRNTMKETGIDYGDTLKSLSFATFFGLENQASLDSLNFIRFRPLFPSRGEDLHTMRKEWSEIQRHPWNRTIVTIDYGISRPIVFCFMSDHWHKSNMKERERVMTAII